MDFRSSPKKSHILIHIWQIFWVYKNIYVCLQNIEKWLFFRVFRPKITCHCGPKCTFQIDLQFFSNNMLIINIAHMKKYFSWKLNRYAPGTQKNKILFVLLHHKALKLTICYLITTTYYLLLTTYYLLYIA